MKKYFYRVFGLVVESEIELPDLIPAENKASDVQIYLGTTEKHLPAPKSKGVLYETAENDFLFKIESIAYYRVRNGNSVLIQPRSDASDEEIRLFLYGSAMGALLHQRGLLPIHGSAVSTESGAIIITGFSAVGKSSIAASLSESGYQILSDDISAVSKDVQGNFILFPGIPYLKLWKDVVSALNITKTLEKVRPQLEKYKFPIFQDQTQESINVTSIILLVPSNEKEIKLTMVQGAKKFNILKTHTYRSNYIDGLGLSEQQFHNISEFASKIQLYEITRPNAPLMLDELKNFIVTNIIHQK